MSSGLTVGHVQDGRLDAARSQAVRRREAQLQTDAGRDEQRVVPIAHRHRPADQELAGVGRHDRVVPLRHADVDGPVVIERGPHCADHLLGVGRGDDRHVRQRPQDGDVLDGEVRRAERGVHHAAAVGDQPDVHVVHAQIDGDLLEAAAGEERGDRVQVDDAAFHRHPGREADEVLLGDALHEEPLGDLRLELGHRADAEVRADEDDALVLAGQFVIVFRQRSRMTASSMAASERSTSWSVTLFLWCHFMLFSANDTPLPLIVWEMIAVGLSASNGQRREGCARSSSTSCPSTSRTANPNARHLSANGSRSCTSCVLAVCLVLVVIDDRGEVREPVLAGAHRRLPDRPLVALAVAEDHEHARVRLGKPQVEGHPEADGQAVAERAGTGLNARHLVGVRVAAEDAVGGAEAVQLPVGEEALVREDRVEGEAAVPLAQDAAVAAGPLRVARDRSAVRRRRARAGFRCTRTPTRRARGGRRGACAPRRGGGVASARSSCGDRICHGGASLRNSAESVQPGEGRPPCEVAAERVPRPSAACPTVPGGAARSRVNWISSTSRRFSASRSARRAISSRQRVRRNTAASSRTRGFGVARRVARTTPG